MEPLPRHQMGPAYRELRTALEAHRGDLTPRQIRFVVLSLDLFPIARNPKLWSESVDIHRAEVDELPEALRRPFRECEVEVTNRIKLQLQADAAAAARADAAPAAGRKRRQG
ncbi:hypothetical protein [Bradyrhizobium sp.]|uniref:hypothetical protein n=1 Tax=Bradyrhizobium sp. TaxID=376 RepID=UPI0025B8D42B|nr:hypothetical protein [Bradyrhizobium sp.]MCA3254948.1 hypothetical protein [Alphaproteobacteria bacterium]MCA3571929.1 hypothetical protein [Bradyrhizobium sp.]